MPWCRLSESNGRPTAYKAVALPTELNRQSHRAASHAGAARRECYLTRLSAGRGPLGGRGGSSGLVGAADSRGTSCPTLLSASVAAGTLDSGEGLLASSVGAPATGTGKAMPWPFSRA